MAGNRGKASNLVHVRVAPPPTPPTVRPREAPIFSLAGSSDLDWIMIGAVCGIVGVLTLLSLVAITYYFAVSRKKGSASTGSSSGSGKAGSTSSMMNADETDSSSFDSDIKQIMSNPLGPSLAALHQPTHTSNGHNPGSHHLNTVIAQGPASTAHLDHLHQHMVAGAGSSGDSGVSSTAGSGNGDTPTLQHGEQHPADSTTATPVYWSASQLLSKLDHHAPNKSAYSTHGPYVVHSGDNYGSYSVAPGPHSLQPGVGGHHAQNGPASLHNASFNDSLRYSASSGVAGPHPGPASASSAGDWEYRPGGHAHIPEEYTITVGNLSRDPSGVDDSRSSRAGSKVPPPVMPKPRNITQV